MRVHDGLVIKLEFAIAQCALQALQPVDIAALASRHFLARRVDVHAALLFCDVTGRIRRVHDILQRTRIAPYFNEPDADPDVEDPVLPHEAVAVDGSHDIVGNLAGLVERASDQKQREFVAANSADRIAIPDRIADDRCDLAQHVVASCVPARIVDQLEPI